MAAEHELQPASRYRRLRMFLAVTPEAIGYEQEAPYMNGTGSMKRHPVTTLGRNS